VERGGGVLLFPSAQARPDQYDALFTAWGGGSFRGFSGEIGARQRIATFERVDLQHPLFEGVFDANRDGGPAEVESPDIFYAMNAPSAGSRGQTLIELSNGFPFLQELRVGQGVALVSAVAPDPQWSDLPVRGLFIPLLYRSVYYLSAGTSVSGETLTAGTASELRITDVSPQDELRLVGPDGVERVPEQRSLFGATLLDVGAELSAPGIYDVKASEALIRRIAVGINARESNLKVAAPEEARDAIQEATGARVRPLDTGGEETVEQALERQQSGTEIWNVFLMLALACLVAEMVVARLWTPEAATPSA
jgi:hypothetical protein